MPPFFFLQSVASNKYGVIHSFRDIHILDDMTGRLPVAAPQTGGEYREKRK
jgi:hypothetical protein